MAEDAAMPSGYDYEFVVKVPDEYICTICHLPMRKPVQTKCGHRFCKACLDEYNKRHLECPVDRKPIGEERKHPLFEDKATERTILLLQIKCPNDGCAWQGELGNLQDHQKHCEYQIVDCDNNLCKVKKPRHQMLIHVQQECQYRMVQCPHCKNMYTFCDLEEHTNVCPKCPVSCPNSCGEKLPREEVTSHKLSECPLTIVPCSYESFGCNFKGKRRDLNDHVMTSMSQHLTITTQQLLSLNTQMDNMETRIRNQFETRIQNEQGKIRDLNDHVMNSMSQHLTITTQLQQLLSLKTQLKESSFFSFIWKVEDFSQQLQNAKQEDSDIRLFSEPFYTHKYGYRLKLELDPNGRGNGKGSHVSVCLIVVRGEYDAILTWPLDWKVKFILLDQKPDNSLRKNIERVFTPDRTDSDKLECYKRPTTDQNTGRGYHTFVSHETLATENYVVDGTLFLQLKLEKP